MQGTFDLTIAAAGISIQAKGSRNAVQGIEPVQTPLPIGYAGSLTTRTDNDTGVVTAVGHNIQTNDKVDVYWSGGLRHNMTAAVAGNAITVDLGAGDNLPALNTAVVICKQTSLDVTFDGDNLVLIAAAADQRSHIDFIDAGGNILAGVELLAGSAWFWISSMAIANPLTGNAVASVKASNGSATDVSNFKLTGLQYAASS